MNTLPNCKIKKLYFAFDVWTFMGNEIYSWVHFVYKRNCYSDQKLYYNFNYYKLLYKYYFEKWHGKTGQNTVAAVK